MWKILGICWVLLILATIICAMLGVSDDQFVKFIGPPGFIVFIVTVIYGLTSAYQEREERREARRKKKLKDWDGSDLEDFFNDD